MTLTEFTSHLKNLDARCGFECSMFAFGVKELGPNLFSYSFDALLLVTVKFEDDGQVRVRIEECDEEKWTFNHASVQDWKDHEVKSMFEHM